MRLDEVFTLDSVPAPTTSYDAIPAGLYEATIANAEIKDSKSGGKYINVRYDITGPSHAGRVVFGMITISNANPKAEEVGRQQLGELIRAIGLDNLADTDQLIGGSLIIKLDVEQSEKYGEQNRVRGFRPTSKGKPAVAATTNIPPWQKK
jgi:hypothetical protein